MKETYDLEQTLCALVRIPTVCGGIYEIDAYRAALERQFPHVFQMAEQLSFGEARLLKLNGMNSSVLPVLFSGHMDVVAANEADGWMYPAFSGHVEQDRIYGRGTLDMKGAQCALLAAAEQLLKQGWRPQHTLYLYLSCDEEVGGAATKQAAAFLEKQGVRLEAVFDEGGTVGDTPDKSGKQISIGMAEKGSAEFRFTARSSGGHAAWPNKNGALVRLGKLMADLEQNDPFRRGLTEQSRQILRKAAEYLPPDQENAWKQALEPGNETALYEVTEQAESLLGATIAFTVLHAGETFNVLPKEAILTANVRMTSIQSLDEIMRILTEKALQYEVECCLVSGNHASAVTELNNWGWQALKQTAYRQWGDLPVIPFTLAGGTDSKHFAALTEQVYRFSPIYIGEEAGKGVHGVNEFITVQSLNDAAQFYETLLHDWI